MRTMTTYEEARAAELQQKFNEGLVNLELECQRQGIKLDASIANEVKKAEIKLNTEFLLMELREEAELKKETQNLQITKNYENRLCLEIVRDQYGKNFRKVIIAEELVASTIFFCDWPIHIEVMLTTFKINGSEVSICMLLDGKEDNYKVFVDRAEAIGVHFLISGKMKTETLKEIFKYVKNGSSREHRPYKRGFWIKDDCWIIEEDKTKTMEVVMGD